MLRLLTDEHISPSVAEQITGRQPEVHVLSLQGWRGGMCLGLNDDDLLLAAREDGLTLVTCDRRTIVPLLRAWGERGQSHAGVIFVNRGAYPANDIGKLVRALTALWHAQNDLDWTNRAIFL